MHLGETVEPGLFSKILKDIGLTKEEFYNLMRNKKIKNIEVSNQSYGAERLYGPSKSKIF
ncbi:MAG: hypothetical protein RXR65_06950 [Hydrogenobaculum sp.]